MDLEAFKKIEAPFAFVDLQLFDQNVLDLKKRAGTLPIRVASKSIRSVELLKRVLKNPGYQGVLAYSGEESIQLFKAGIKDIVVAYPIACPIQLAKVAQAIKAGAEITLMVDLLEHLKLTSAAADSAGVKIPIAFDLDMSSPWPGLHFGVHRSALTTPEKVCLLLSDLKQYPQLKLDGVMAYEAQIAGVGDLSIFVHWLKLISQRQILKRRKACVQAIKDAGYKLRFVNGGGTGSFEFTKTDSVVTELAAGSAFYSPILFDQYRKFRHRPAMGFVLDVTRKCAADVVTCYSGGYIASGSAEALKQPVPVWPEGLKLFPLEGAGEVQTPLHGASALEMQVGDRVVFRHAKSGEACERFNEIYLLENGKVTSSVKTYRGEGWNFG